MWPYDSFGKYAVKDGYNLLQNFHNAVVNSTDKRVRKTIWGSQILKKTKKIIWRVFKRCLPIKTKLARRHINMNPFCPLCVTQDEIEIHILFKCKEVAEVWRRRGLD